jgi:tetratricopeptide (TPR) repeat protein
MQKEKGATTMLSRYSNMNNSALRLLAISILSAAVLSGCLSTPPAPPSDEEQATWDGAIKQMKRKRYEKAIPTLQAISNAQPSLPGPQLNLGIAHANLGRDQQALAHLNQALKLGPQLADDQANAWNQIGLIQVRAGQYKDAIKSYKRALVIAPGYDKAQFNLALVYDKYLNDPNEAMRQYKLYQAMRSRPDNAVGLFIKRIELEQQSALQKASTSQ